jgi:hypothetical protein
VQEREPDWVQEREPVWVQERELVWVQEPELVWERALVRLPALEPGQVRGLALGQAPGPVPVPEGQQPVLVRLPIQETG